jgi:type II secretion system protein G
MGNLRREKGARAFTLIEVMLVISIIGLLASVILSSLSLTKAKANTAKRMANVTEIQKALEVYYLNNKAYPSTGGSLQSLCTTWGGVTAWIPNLTPTYIGALPNDPDTDGVSKCCYLYRSNGTDYKLMFAFGGNAAAPTCTPVIGQYGTYASFIDPARDGGSNSAIQDWNGSTNLYDWAIYTPGGATW